ncbi:MAG: outer membrane beta-barrel protein [Tannerellaceae bacterium]|nr:outer membrane beta-barrel protein [Tannerellaceae bacterium]
MKKEERDILEDLFRDKLYNHEEETTPGDWEMIAGRLPEPQPVVHTFRRRVLYWSAAAVAALVVSSGLLFLADRQPDASHHIVQHTNLVVADAPEEETGQSAPVPASTTIRETSDPVVVSATTTHIASARTTSAERGMSRDVPVTDVDPVQAEEHQQFVTAPADKTETEKTDKTERPVITPTQSNTTLLADAQPVTTPKEKTRRWGFGMGGGSMTASANNSFNTLVQHSAGYREDKQLLYVNTAAMTDADLSTEIKHKTPVSIGLSASYALNNRWAILSGLSYTMLTTDFEHQAMYGDKVRRRLHFIGIPVSISYRIAEWNDFQLYAAAGFMPELNVAGNNRIQRYSEDELLSTTHEHIRIKRLFWSVNGRAGISYPVIRYVNAFAEVGAAYYFDNGSEIETIRSEKPFNVSLNFGLRFGF